MDAREEFLNQEPDSFEQRVQQGMMFLRDAAEKTQSLKKIRSQGVKSEGGNQIFPEADTLRKDAERALQELRDYLQRQPKDLLPEVVAKLREGAESIVATTKEPDQETRPDAMYKPAAERMLTILDEVENETR